LPANGINGIVQTKDGFIWMGTSAGLVRFDGMEFKAHDLGNDPKAQNCIVTSVASSKTGGIWAGLEHSSFGYCDEDKFSFRGKPEWGRLDLNVRAVLESGNGQLWLAALEGEIEERTRMQIEVERIHREPLETSRLAGMTEIATNVLHNVGNVLNSVNVSASLVTDRVTQSPAVKLTRVVAMLKEHEGDLGAFITNDVKGRRIPSYLGKLSEQILADQAATIEELQSLSSNIEHIKEIVAMQQNYARVSGVKELVNVRNLAEDSLRMNLGALDRHGVKVIRHYQNVPLINVEKHKILQILINLLRNAKYACDDSGRLDKQVTLRVANGNGRIKISVMDHGIGIPNENLNRIFNHGFTTRKNGRGFGLHGGALAAKEMGGALTASSEGPGKGACFTLELPLTATVGMS
jgi:signal transduction histidine kinase